MHAPITSPIPLAASVQLPFCTHRPSFLFYARILSTPLAPFTLSSTVVHFYSMLPPPREHIQFASDARRDRAEILIDIRIAFNGERSWRKREIVGKSYRFYILTLIFSAFACGTGYIYTDISRSWDSRVHSVIDLVL